MAKRISEQRKTLYYVGLVMQGVGSTMFLSTFIIHILYFGDFSNFESRVRMQGLLAVGGMVLIIIGGIIKAIGARGMAGAGVILDPQLARRDLEPYSRMAGGMVRDALDEADIESHVKQHVMIKCRNCGKLCEESAKFCPECGKPL